MLQKTTLHFLKQLREHNYKEWFDVNKKAYQEAKENVLTLTEELLKQISRFDSSILQLTPKDCVFRINRDVRFSKDKSPYKTNMGISIAPLGKKGISAGYYLHIEPGASFVGGGLYMPMAPELKKVRQEIDYNWQAFSKIIRNKNFSDRYTDLNKTKDYSLSRPPKGYDADNPAIEYLKLKSFISFIPLSDSKLTNETLVKDLTIAFKTLYPLIEFLNQALEIHE
jgi:uncharacterized protein (TIGR02453 family)